MTLAASVEKTQPVQKNPTTDKAQPPATDASTTALRALTMSDSPSTVEPSKYLPSPPVIGDTPPPSGAEAAIKAVPSAIPVGTMSKSELEAPLRDRARFEHCGIPRGTQGEISAVIYNGAAVEVDVRTKPNDRALNFCIEHTVRQLGWMRDLAVNKVKVPF